VSARRVLVPLADASSPWSSGVAAPLLAGGLAVGAGLFLLGWVDVLDWTSWPGRVRPFVGPAVGLAVAAALLRRVVGDVLVRMPRPPERPASFPVHGLPQIRAFVNACNAESEPDIRNLVDYLVHQGVTAGASDIHLVPYERFTLVRYRLDGILQDAGELRPDLWPSVTNRLKILSRLVTYVRDRPQDGRFELLVGGRRIDVRVAFMPTLHGERVVLRVLSRSAPEQGLAALGLTEAQKVTLEGLIRRPEGMVILTGPTGAGKTTTIYCALNAILRESERARSIYTLEDPIEYDLLQINQTQVDRGFGFAQGLRSMLRQDPDVIMVGEIRDLETAGIALQAGLTGHLIITTVHARSAAGVFARLIEMGADPHSVASAVTAVVAQRLVRVLCDHCKAPEPELSLSGHSLRLGRPLTGLYHAPRGCPRCHGKGYQGRRALFEVLEMHEGLARSVIQRAPAEDLVREAARRGMKTLNQLGLEMAQRGETSLDEVLRIAPGEPTPEQPPA
jgi:type II secretory ATPase GspE/PulE/Tfp pilus assembly ATPase PilB-like protein